MAQVGSMRGLSQYIKKIRAATTQEDREAIVHKELAKIREKYSKPHRCNAYDRKKYTWKLLYSHMMGFQVDFGHKQAADLIPSKNFDEKQVGYQALTILLNENDDFMTLPVNNVLKDLQSGNELFMSLALNFAGAVAGPEMSAAIESAVRNILLNSSYSPHVRKKAALCMLRLYRKLPADSGIIEASQWQGHLAALLDTPGAPGLQLSVMGLIIGVLEESGPEGYEALRAPIIDALGSLVNAGVSRDYLYYGIPCPWLQCKYMRALMYFPIAEDTRSNSSLETTLRAVIQAPVPPVKMNNNLLNARTAIFVEAVALALKLDNATLVDQALDKLIGSLTSRDANSRYVALETLSNVAIAPEAAAKLRGHINELCQCLQDSDPGVKKRAIDVITGICDAQSVETIVATLLEHMTVAEANVKTELVLKVAILAERFPPSIEWYVNSMIQLMDIGAEEVSETVWHRAVHLIANTSAMQQETAQSLLKKLEAECYSVPIINTAGYVLSEFADTLTDRSPSDIASVLLSRYDIAPPATQAMLLTALLKLRVAVPSDEVLKARVEAVFEHETRSFDPDTQQRAIEYLMLSRHANLAGIAEVCAPMPQWEGRGQAFGGGGQQGEDRETNGSASAAAVDAGAEAEAEAATEEEPNNGAAAAAAAAEKEAGAGEATSAALSGAMSGSGEVARERSAGVTGTSGAVPVASGEPAAAPSLSGALLDFGPDDDTPAPNSLVDATPAEPPEDPLADLMGPELSGSAPPPPSMPSSSAPDPSPFAAAARPSSAVLPAEPREYAQRAPSSTAPFDSQRPPSLVLASQSPSSQLMASQSDVQRAPSQHMQPMSSQPMQSMPSQPMQLMPSQPMQSAPSAQMQSVPSQPMQPVVSANPFDTAPSMGGSAAFASQMSASLGGSGPPPPQRVDDLAAQLPRMLALGKGILLEDSMLQVGLIATLASDTALGITLFCGNKSETAVIESLAFFGSPHPAVQIMPSPGLPVIQPQQQVQIHISAAAFAPCGSAPLPKLTISYRVGPHQMHYDVDLPVTDARFLRPNGTVTQASFFSTWGAITSHAPHALSADMATLPAPLPDGAALTAHMTTLGFSDGGARLDPTNALNYAGAAHIGSLDVLVRVEVNPADTTQLKITVVCVNDVLAASLRVSVASSLQFLMRPSPF